MTTPGQTVIDDSAGFPGAPFEAESSGPFARLSFGAGSRVGPAVVLGVLSQSRTSVIYRAVDLRSGLDVVIKALDPRLNDDERARARFEREVGLSTTLAHPNLLRALESGSQGGVRYLISEYLPRGTLEGALPVGRRRLPLEVIGDWLSQLAEGLDYLHRRTIVHRDLKPDNVLLGSGPRRASLKITDFGLAFDPSAPRLSAVNSRLGTPNYMSPEQVRGRAPTPAADVYALGCIAYRLLTHELPYSHQNPNTVAAAHLSAPIPRVVRPQLPPRIGELVHRMLAKEPAARPRTDEILHTLAMLR